MMSADFRSTPLSAVFVLHVALGNIDAALLL